MSPLEHCNIYASTKYVQSVFQSDGTGPLDRMCHLRVALPMRSVFCVSNVNISPCLFPVSCRPRLQQASFVCNGHFDLIVLIM